jgi:hypothetical protein
MSYKNSGSQHYIKWDITEDLSLRYYFEFQDRPQYINQYVLKTHSTKNYQLIESNQISNELKKLSSNHIEIIGRRINKTEYVKYKINNFGDATFIKVTEDTKNY